VSVVRLIVATRSSGPQASGKIIKEMPVSVASETPYIFQNAVNERPRVYVDYLNIIFYKKTARTPPRDGCEVRFGHHLWSTAFLDKSLLPVVFPSFVPGIMV